MLPDLEHSTLLLGIPGRWEASWGCGAGGGGVGVGAGEADVCVLKQLFHRSSMLPKTGPIGLAGAPCF